MQKLIDKLVLTGLCLVAFTLKEIDGFSIATLLFAVAISSLCGYFENKLPVFLCAGSIVLCLLIPGLTIFLPLIVYDCAGFDKWPLRLCWIVALPVCFTIGAPQIPIAIVLSSIAAFVLHIRTTEQLKVREEYYAIVDNAKESAELLERKNRDLMEKQDYEVRLATLSERNRIAREIHDNVGHMLTRSLLQIGALGVTHTGDDKLTGELDMIKGTLSGAMDSIRNSVHDLHDESLDLRSQLEAIADDFRFCPVKLRYDAGELPVGIRYCFAAIAREAFNNIARHSNASEASITVIEHPAFCQLVISDNGTVKASESERGIGIQNMADRVDALGGVFRAEHDKGFRIFISVPKGITGGVSK